MAKTKYDLEDRLIRFGATACGLCATLPDNPVGRLVSLQLIRCATSPFANYAEVQSAESRRDFIHKLQVCLKELRETRAWLKFILQMEISHGPEVAELQSECDELVAILTTSVRTARRNAGRNEECPMSSTQGSLIIGHGTLDILKEGLAAVYSPTDDRRQYHRRWRS